MGERVKKISDFDPIYVDCWAWHQTFRRLGFSADDIYVEIARNGSIEACPLFIFMSLISQGRKFSAAIGPAVEPESVIAQRWTALCEAFNAKQIDEGDLATAYEARMAHLHVSIVNALLNKGFDLNHPGEAGSFSS
jgi:hypothetical protein